MADAEPTARCWIRRADATVEELSADRFAEIDALRSEPGVTVWLALHNPTSTDLGILADEFALHPLALEDVERRNQRPKIDAYPDQHMLVMYEALAGPPASGDGTAAFELGELHLFGGPGWLVTVQWGESPAVDAGRLRFGRRGDGGPPLGGGGMLYAIFDAAADSYFPILDVMAERMDALEDRVLAGDGGRESLREMLAIKRELLELRRVLGPMRDVANALLRRPNEMIDDQVEPYFQDLYDHLVRILDQLDLYRDLLASVLDARLTVTSNSLNAIMKRLTAITVILMVPTMIAGIYGMNFEYMPELEWPLGYPFALGLMLLAVIGSIVYFRRRDWL
jgi:magnesium transporter